jgi:hypothetical protein
MDALNNFQLAANTGYFDNFHLAIHLKSITTADVITANTKFADHFHSRSLTKYCSFIESLLSSDPSSSYGSGLHLI